MFWFPENVKMLPTTYALQNCIPAGVRVSGRTKYTAWLSNKRGRAAYEQQECVDLSSLMFISILTAIQICSQACTEMHSDFKTNGPHLNTRFSRISIAITVV